MDLDRLPTNAPKPEVMPPMMPVRTTSTTILRLPKSTPILEDNLEAEVMSI